MTNQVSAKNLLLMLFIFLVTVCLCADSAERFPAEVVNELIRGAAFLDDEYGEERDCTESGGYSIVAEDEADLPDVKAKIDYDRHPCEWATVLGKSGYCSALYVMNDDFSIMLYLPITCAPGAILRELEP